jgi:suppressor of ftsI
MRHRADQGTAASILRQRGVLLTRRQALLLGAAGAASGALLVTGCGRSADAVRSGDSTTSTVPTDPPLGDELAPPPEVVSSGGVLAATLVAATSDATIAGRSVRGATTYNGSFPGETWRIRPGDTFAVDLTNDLDTFTNLHWHGLHVTPNGNADNVFLEVDPGDTLTYEVPVPANHASGAYWYHPHVHTVTDEQVYGGLAGLILIDGGWLDQPGIAEATEKVMVIKGVVIDDGAVTSESPGVSSNELYTINAQVNPRVSAAPGERQLWRIANLGNDTFFNISLEGHSFTVVATDGIPVPAPFETDAWRLPPAGRVEVLVEAGETGSYRLRNRAVDEGFETFGERTLATLVVEGAPVTALPPIPDALDGAPPDLRTGEPDVERTLVFGSSSLVTGTGDVEETGNWMICDLTFNGARTDISARLGDLEEWTLTNHDTEDHPFHIHQNDFQVVSVNGVAQEFEGHRDTFPIPRGGQIKVRQRFEDFTGRWVFHCHILFHEDHGMMGTIEVT